MTSASSEPGASYLIGVVIPLTLKESVLVMLTLLCWLLKLFALGAIAWVGVAAVGALLLYEHLIVSPTDLRRLNAAFFTLNGVISMVFFFFIAAALLIAK